MNLQILVVAILCLIVVGTLSYFAFTSYFGQKPKPFGRNKADDFQDPTVRPDGYQPPTTAEELLARYKAGERYFAGTNLSGFDLSGADLSNINLSSLKIDRLSVQAKSDVKPPLKLKGMDFERTPLGGMELIHTIGAPLDEGSVTLDPADGGDGDEIPLI